MKLNIVNISLLIISIPLIFSGCAKNNTISKLPSGTHDADTFRQLHDPDPNVNYKTQKRKTYKKLDLPSGTYDASTFREKYDPDPNLTYSNSKKKTGTKYVSSNSSSPSASQIFGAILVGLGSFADGYNSTYSGGVNYPIYRPSSTSSSIPQIGPSSGFLMGNSNSGYGVMNSNNRRSTHSSYGLFSNNNSNQPNYRSLNNVGYKYDLTNPVDRNNYSLDLNAQMNDRLNTNPSATIDRMQGIQHGGGIMGY